jgi:hypothetical protein
MRTEVTKVKGIRGYFPQALQEQLLVETNGGNRLEQLLRELHDFQKPTVVLKPTEIDGFFQSVDHAKLDEFTNNLIQNSYDAGNNDFKLHSHKKQANICSDLVGQEDNLLRIEIFGNVGDYCGRGASYVQLHLHGNANLAFASAAHNSEFIVDGNVDLGCAEYGTSCKMTIQGDFSGYDFAYKARDSEFILHGELSDDFSELLASRCVVKFLNPKNRQFLRCLANRGMKAYFIGDDGREGA